MVRSRIFLYFGGAALLLGFLLSLLTGCASFRQMEMLPLPENLPASHELTAVPFFHQEKMPVRASCFSNGNLLERFACPT